MKPLTDWSTKDLLGTLLLAPSAGGIALSINDAKILYNAKVNGQILSDFINLPTPIRTDYDLINKIKPTIALDYKQQLPRICSKLISWLERKPIDSLQVVLDKYTWLKISGDLDMSDISFIIEQILQEMQNMNFSKNLNLKIEAINDQTNHSLGFLSKNIKWPFVSYGSNGNIKLDWRCSTEILPSRFEQENLENLLIDNKEGFPFFNFKNSPRKRSNTTTNTTSSNTTSIHEYLITKLREEKKYIHILLALSGAGKTHTLFYVNTSNTAYTIPIDFGSIEDYGINESISTLLIRIVSLCGGLVSNEESDPNINMINVNICNEISSIISTIFTIRVLILILYLRYCKERREMATPSNWIKYIYSSGSSDFSSFISSHFDIIMKIPLFQVIDLLKLELDSNEYSECKNIVLVVDEINPLLTLGYGHKILTKYNTNGSVATLLLCLLEKVLSNIGISSIISGTSVNSSLIISSSSNSKLDEHINWVQMYGPTNFNQLLNFTTKFISIPKLEYRNQSLFHTICIILEGRRRAFMNFVEYTRESPCPIHSHNDWFEHLLWKSFASFNYGSFKMDISNFISNRQELQLQHVKLDISILLMMKNRLTKEDITQIITLHYPEEEIETLETEITPLLVNSIINNGLAFGRVECETVFQSFEVSNMIYLAMSICDKHERIEVLLNKWILNVLSMGEIDKKEGKDKDELMSEIFEIIGALVLIRISYELKGKPLSSCSIFPKQEIRSFLNTHTLPYPLPLIHNKQDYWKVMMLFLQKYYLTKNVTNLFCEVCVIGLDSGVNVKSICIASSIDNSSDLPLPIEVNMVSKFIKNSHHPTEFNNFYHATNDFQHEVCREEVNSLLEKKCSSSRLRIIFDYTHTNQFNEFEQLLQDNTNNDIIVLFGKGNPEFMIFFKNHFPNIFKTLEMFLK